jgi:hypothetical protein
MKMLVKTSELPSQERMRDVNTFFMEKNLKC